MLRLALRTSRLSNKTLRIHFSSARKFPQRILLDVRQRKLDRENIAQRILKLEN